MQPMSPDPYRHEQSPEQWVENVKARPVEHEEQENQWAVLRHEVEADTSWQQEPRPMEWVQNDTEHDLFPTPFYAGAPQSLPQVDIAVVGVGGGGSNAINRMIAAGVRGVRFVAMNTDAQALAFSHAPSRICLGRHNTRGLGAGGDAAVGTRAATESAAEIRAALGDADLVFIAAGMGGGTGTGAAPIVASIAKKLGALTIGIVTFPFMFEGTQRRRSAERGLAALGAEVDALITVPNDRLLSAVGRERRLTEAFMIADDVLRQGVQGIAEVITVPGMVNVDFADVRSVLSDAGTALMSIGQGRGRDRAQKAAEEAIAGGFLNVTIRGAQRVLFNISGGEDMTLFEVNEVAERISQAIDDAADITFGAVIDPTLQDTMRVTLIAAGMEESRTRQMPAIRLDQLQQMQDARIATRQASQPAPQPMVDAYPQAARSPQQPSTDQQGTGIPRPATQPPVMPPLPPRQSSLPGRQQRSLNDLRGIRSLGRRHEALRGRQADENDEAIDVPPFMKRFD